MITKTTHPYEVLIRFEGEHVLGAHIQRIEIIREDGEIISARPLPPEPITGDFPIAEALDEMHVSTLKTIEELKSQLAAALQNLEAKTRAVAFLAEEGKSAAIAEAP